jgi:hypothetical protein
MKTPKKQTVARTYATGSSGRTGALRRIVAGYDAALAACTRRDAATLDAVLDLMQRSLNFGAWPSLGLVLYAQYHTCRRHAEGGEFLEAGRILAKLRSAWMEGGRRAGIA